MVDLHSHIIPGIDDGARTVEDALSLITQSVESGVTKIVATPHLNIGRFDNNIELIDESFQSLCAEVEKQGISVQLAYAAEVRICPEIIMLANSKRLPFVGKHQGNNLLLLEFPDSHIPPGSDKLVDWLLTNNITPLIAHPERNRELWQHPYLINEFVKKGCLLQLTASSLLGDFGDRSEHLAFHYLNEKQVHLIASDMHNMKRRPNRMLDAFNLIEEQYSREFAQTLCVENPEQVFSSNSTVQAFGELS